MIRNNQYQYYLMVLMFNWYKLFWARRGYSIRHVRFGLEGVAQFVMNDHVYFWPEGVAQLAQTILG